MDFRAEAFNVFNRVVFGGPQTSLNSNTFGVISSQANSPRQMQGGIKAVLVGMRGPAFRRVQRVTHPHVAVVSRSPINIEVIGLRL